MSEWWSLSFENRNNSLLICWPIEEMLQKLSMTHDFHFRKTLPGIDIRMEKQSKEMSNVPGATICSDAFSQMHESGCDKPFAGNEIRDVLCFIR